MKILCLVVLLLAVSCSGAKKQTPATGDNNSGNEIMLVEDDANLGMILKESLELSDYKVDHFKDGEIAWNNFTKNTYDLCLLDIMMPKKDGFTLAQEIRKVDTSVPIIFLTAKSMKEDKIEGFRVGADDYVTKPFSPRELVARVRVVLRRASGDPSSEMIRVGEVSIDRARYEAALPDKTIELTPTEFEILAALMSQPGRIFSRAQLLTAVHGIAFESYERAIDSHIRNLRRKLETASGETRYIITVHGVGYKFES